MGLKTWLGLKKPPEGRRARIKRLWHPIGHLSIPQRDFLIAFLRMLRPRYCFEIGFASGRSTVTTLVSADPRLLVCVDSGLDYIRGARAHADLIRREFPALRIVEGLSHTVVTEGFLRKSFRHGIDFAFIDGDHTYAGAMSDITATLPFLNPHGVMLVDDYRSGKPDGAYAPGVDRAVDELVAQRGLIFDRWYHRGKGVAILRHSLAPRDAPRDPAASPT